MSSQSSGAGGSGNKSKIEGMSRSIEHARSLALAYDNEFLIYLLDMALLEAAELAEQGKS